MKAAFDPECYSLACYFLDDTKGVTEARRNALAAAIQQTVDDFGKELIEEDEANYGEYIDSKIDEWRETGERPNVLPYRGRA